MNEDLERVVRGIFAAYRLIKKLQKPKKALGKPETFETINPAPADFDGTNYWIPRPPLYRWIRRIG